MFWKILRNTGYVLLAIGGMMLLFGASALTYQGDEISPLLNEVAKWSFICWIPVLILGAVMMETGSYILNKKTKNRNLLR